MKTRSKHLFILPALLAGLGLIPAGRVTAQTFTNLYSFTATGGAYSNSDGAYPSAGLILSGNTLYGTTQLGGTNGEGTVFAVHTDGTGFTTLHSFKALINSTNSDGANPQAGLFLSGQFLFGTTVNGGTNGNGTVFFLRTDGLYFTNLHNFTALINSTNSDGAKPAAGLILSDLFTLCGTAQSGGTNGNGTVFAVNADGTGFTVLHTFTATKSGTNSDGATPLGGLIASANDTLYGTANGGGTYGNGTVFALNPDGTGFTNLYSFTAFSPVYFNNIDGENPYGGLVLSGNTLYGTTHSGGTNNAGTVFAVTTNGTGFTVLHGFTGNSDGANPYAGLVLSGSTLFGTAGNGGTSYDGTLFAVNTNGTGFTTPHTFTNSPDGYSPHAGLISSGNTLYGTANGGTNGTGMVFSLSLPTPQLAITFSGSGVVMIWPTNLLNFTLQSTTNLDPVWSPVPLSPVIINGQNVVTNPISGAPQQFFRLSL